MLTTKTEILMEFLKNKTPKNEYYENYICNLNEENVLTFEVNKENINIEKLKRELNEIGFVVLNSKKINKKTIFFRVKEI